MSLAGLNDCHIHIGKVSGINQYMTAEELPKLKETVAFIDKVVIMGTDVNPDNDLIYGLCHSYDWCYGLHWYTNDRNEIVLDDKLIGVKYHGAYHNKPVTEMSPRVLESLNRNKRILMVHCGRYLEGDIKSNTSYLHALKVARNYPSIKVIMSHMGGTDTTVCRKAIFHAQNLQNVYFDTSGITTPYIIEYALELLPSHRILFGSDLPWCSYNAMIWTVQDSMISQEQKKLIYHDNLELLLNAKKE